MCITGRTNEWETVVLPYQCHWTPTLEETVLDIVALDPCTRTHGTAWQLGVGHHAIHLTIQDHDVYPYHNMQVKVYLCVVPNHVYCKMDCMHTYFLHRVIASKSNTGLQIRYWKGLPTKTLVWKTSVLLGSNHLKNALPSRAVEMLPETTNWNL